MSDDDTDDLRPEYPANLIRSGVHGKYARQFREDFAATPDDIDA